MWKKVPSEGPNISHKGGRIVFTPESWGLNGPIMVRLHLPKVNLLCIEILLSIIYWVASFPLMFK